MTEETEKYISEQREKTLDKFMGNTMTDIARIMARLDGIEKFVRRPLEPTEFDPKFFCIEIDSSENHFSDFIEWIRKENKEFYQKIMFNSVPYISRDHLQFSISYDLRLPMWKISDWAEWCVKEKLK